MATKQVTIKDTSSNTLHPVTDSDVVYVGNNSLTSELSDAVHFDTISPATAVDPITASMIAGGASPETLANGALVEVVGTTTNDFNYALKFADGRLACFQKITITNKAVTQAWGSDYMGIIAASAFANFAVAFSAAPAVNISFIAEDENKNTAWAINTGGVSTTKPGQCYLVRPNSATVNGSIHIIAYGFWK